MQSLSPLLKDFKQYCQFKNCNNARCYFNEFFQIIFSAKSSKYEAYVLCLKQKTVFMHTIKILILSLLYFRIIFWGKQNGKDTCAMLCFPYFQNLFWERSVLNLSSNDLISLSGIIQSNFFKDNKEEVIIRWNLASLSSSGTALNKKHKNMVYKFKCHYIFSYLILKPIKDNTPISWKPES